MSRCNAMDEVFEEVTLLGETVLFTSLRIDRKTIPEGYYLYELRHDDDGCGDVVHVARNIMVNHWGSVITRDEIALPDDGCLNVEPDCINYGIGDCTSMDDYMNNYPRRN